MDVIFFFMDVILLSVLTARFQDKINKMAVTFFTTFTFLIRINFFFI